MLLPPVFVHLAQINGVVAAAEVPGAVLQDYSLRTLYQLHPCTWCFDHQFDVDWSKVTVRGIACSAVICAYPDANVPVSGAIVLATVVCVSVKRS